MAKLSIGSLASMANPVVGTSVHVAGAFNGTTLQNFPNPFSGSTTISYRLEKDSYVHISLFNSLGHEVMTLDRGIKNKGEQTLELEASDLPQGLYFINLRMDQGFVNHKIVIQ
jgi:serine protease AprX